MQEIIAQCGEPFRTALRALPGKVLTAAREVRIRVGRPVAVIGERETLVSAGGKPLCPKAEELEELLLTFCGRSLYAYEAQLAQGFITLRGGHRVGVCGKTVVKNGHIARISEIQSMNIRVARQLACGGDVLPRLLDGEQVRSTLVLSKPGFGKTTLLRQLAKQLSDRGMQVSLLDERAELAAMMKASPMLDVGARTDVLEGCGKSEGVRLLLRSMAPQVIVTDEIGAPEDLSALSEAVRSGAAVLASAHAADLPDAKRRLDARALEVFDRFVLLGGAPGHVTAILDREGRPC